MHRAYKYRLYPTEEQAAQLNQSFAAVRWVYNAALEQRNLFNHSQEKDYFSRKSNYFNPVSQSKQLNYLPKNGQPGLADDEELKWITLTPKTCLEAALRDLDQAFKRFFDGRKKGTGEGYPSFRSADRNNSISFKAWDRRSKDGKKIEIPIVLFGQDCVKLPKIGRVKYKRHRKFYGDPKTVEVVREGREFYVILVTEHKFKTIKHKGPAVGLDLGVALPVCLSNGEAIAPDLGLETLEKKARKVQKRLSRAQRGSQRRKQTKQQLADIKRKQARRRTARTHVITTELTRHFSYVAIEDLKLKNMTGSAKGDPENPGKKVKQKAGLNRAILNVSMYKIREQLEYKSEKSGTTVKAVDPKGTSQTCSKCGHRSPTNRLKQAVFKCQNKTCGHQENADVNAAKNILKRANPSAAVLGRHKSPSKSTALGIISKKPTDLATTKASGSCFQPASVLKMAMESRGLRDVR